MQFRIEDLQRKCSAEQRIESGKVNKKAAKKLKMLLSKYSKHLN